MKLYNFNWIKVGYCIWAFTFLNGCKSDDTEVEPNGDVKTDDLISNVRDGSNWEWQANGSYMIGYGFLQERFGIQKMYP